MKTQHQTVQTLIVSIIYAAVLEVSNRLLEISLFEGASVNVAIFVPIIAAIIFGKNVGAGSAAGGKIFSIAGTSLISGQGSSLLDPVTLLPIIADSIGVYLVGMLTKHPESRWDDLKTRFSSMETWRRLGENSLGGLAGMGLGASLIRSLSIFIDNEGLGTDFLLSELVRVFILNFFVNSLLILLFIPAALILYEIGDVLIEKRAHDLDKKLRNILYLTPEENAVSILSVVLPERAFTAHAWTPVKIKFRNTLERPTRFHIEAIANARITPPIDKTKILEPGEVWEQSFFVLPKNQRTISLNIRMTPFLDKITETTETKETEETILEITGKSHDPTDAKLTYLVFSVANFAIMGVSVILDRLEELIGSFDLLVISLQKSWSFLAFVTVVEASLFGLGVGIYWFYLNKFKMDLRKNLSFSTDFSTAKYLNEATTKFRDLVLTRLKKRLNSLVTTTLIFTVTISIIVLGIEGYRMITEPNYMVLYPEQLIFIAILVFIGWVLGLQGRTLLQEAGLISSEEMTVDGVGPLISIKPTSTFFEGVPNTCILTIKNPMDRHGVRIEFVSEDVVSPTLLEVNLPPNKEVKKNVIIVPSGIGKRSVLCLAYPLFDENGQLMSRKEAEPYSHQRIDFSVVPRSQFGLTIEQQARLKKLLILVGVIASIIYGSDVILRQYITDLSLIQFLRENFAFLLALQAPFVYAYFFVRNRFKIDFLDVDKLLEQISASDTLATNLDKTVGNNMEKQVPDIIKNQFSDQLKNNLTQYIRKDIMDQLAETINEHYRLLLEEELNAELTKQVQDLSAMILAENLENVPDDTNQALSIRTMMISFIQQHSEIQKLLANYRTSSNPDEQAKIKDKIKAMLKEEIKQQASAPLKDLLKAHLTDEEQSRKLINKLVGKLKTTVKEDFIRTLKEKINEELENESEGGLIDQIFAAVEANITEELRTELNSRLDEKFNSRQLLMKLAQEVDEKTGKDFGKQLEDTIGTAGETEVIQTLRDEFLDNIKKPLEDRLKQRLREEIKKHLKKMSDKVSVEIFDDLVSTQVESLLVNLEDWFEQKIAWESIMETFSDDLVDSLLEEFLVLDVSVSRVEHEEETLPDVITVKEETTDELSSESVS